MNDFFGEKPYWEEDRFPIPSVGDTPGIGREISTCGQDDAAQLEFRADGAFKQLSLRVAPGTATAASDETLVLGVFDNADFIDSVKVPYGKVGELKRVRIQGVSALKLRLWLDEAVCDGSMFAVLYDVNVS